MKERDEWPKREEYSSTPRGRADRCTSVWSVASGILVVSYFIRHVCCVDDTELTVLPICIHIVSHTLATSTT